MKTTAQKLMVIAVVAFFGLSLNAQNTKSIRLTYYKTHLTDAVNSKFDRASNFLVKEMNDLKALVRYTPSELEEERYRVENETDFSSTLEELKKLSKFTPSELPNLNAEYSENNERLNNALTELEDVVKFKPGNLLHTETVEVDFNEALAELSKVVKYTPAPNV